MDKTIEKTTDKKSLILPDERKRIDLAKFMKQVGEAKQLKPAFIDSVITLINTAEAGNYSLLECSGNSIFNACLTAETLALPISKSLGMAHIVPYRNGKTKKMEAQFQVGWKGLVQLSMRSGQFARINVVEVQEGELKKIDHLSGDIEFEWHDVRDKEVVGYVAYFRLLNGFEKSLYMTVAECEAHAQKYSQAYKSGFGMWASGFDSMAKKTVLKLLLDRFAPKSVEMATALSEDQRVEGEYKDNPSTLVVEDKVVDGEVVED
jgi:recombination protein RecT